ncbi:MAG: hypothetical protein JW749_11095 [Sedimentisphaerales bacterium]|nr:hypothetical protein [Sedimentisphaerales bacterium]
MGINQTIFDSIKDLLNTYDDKGYYCNKDDIESFLKTREFTKRQKAVISIIGKIMTTHGKKPLIGTISELARVEYGTRELKPFVRDHVVHAMLSFLLGIYINENLLKLSHCDVKPFPWKVAGLFHDIGYPMQIASNIHEPFTKKINEIKRDLGVSAPDVSFKVIPEGLDKLTYGANTLELFQDQLDKWELKIDANKEYKAMVDSGQISHGIISSLSVLHVIDLMYQKYNPERKDECTDQYDIPWGQLYFKNDVVPACAAIFVHDLDHCLKKSPLDRKRAPLAFLLKLSDCLQEWERPNADQHIGVSNDRFGIHIANGKLEFTVDDKKRRDKIEKEIKSSLVAPDIEVV